jgi:GDP-D-mannose 3',5'-epimerase
VYLSGLSCLTKSNVGSVLSAKARGFDDNRLIKEKLGWQPAKSLEEGLAKTYPWVAEQVRALQNLLVSSK